MTFGRTFYLVAASLVILAISHGGSLQAAIIVDDSFADGDRANTGPLQADWWSSSSTSGNSVEAAVGELGLITGTSGRGIHGTFAPQTLAVGQTIIATYTFTTPATVGTNKGAAFKVALMDFNNAGLADDLSSSSSSVNPLYANLPGYMTDFDINLTGSNLGKDDTSIRKHQAPNTVGRFLGTTTGWDQFGSSGDAGYSFLPNTEYVGVLSVERTGADSVDIFGSLSQGTTLLDSHTEEDASGIANNFGMLGFWANSNTFGSTTSSDPDNGITFSNIKVEVVPEPSSLVLLMGGILFSSIRKLRR